MHKKHGGSDVYWNFIAIRPLIFIQKVVVLKLRRWYFWGTEDIFDMVHERIHLFSFLRQIFVHQTSYIVVTCLLTYQFNSKLVHNFSHTQDDLRLITTVDIL